MPSAHPGSNVTLALSRFRLSLAQSDNLESILC
jgi:hypothetical protein